MVVFVIMERYHFVMKKVPFVVMVVILYMSMLTGCTGSRIPLADDNRFHVVCTTFPQYDWVVNLIRGNEETVSVTLLMDKGSDLHNFQPSALDMARVSECDLFIYVGGGSDVWVDDALKEAVNPGMRVINMMEAVSERLVGEEHIEDADGHDHGEHEEYDEHIWLSVRNAELIVEKITAELAGMDGENAAVYESNCDRYLAALSALDIRYAEMTAESGRSALLFADRFPFRYLVEDYGLDYYAAFNGCSAETEASFGTVASLADRLAELQLGYVIVLDGSDDRLAQVIIENAGTGHQQILVLNSMQSVSQRDIKAGLSYLNVMEENLKVLEQALE